MSTDVKLGQASRNATIYHSVYIQLITPAQSTTHDDDNSKLKSRILVARQLAGISQAELAQRAKTSQSAIAAYESHAKTPSDDVMRRILNAVEFRPSRLLHAHREEFLEILHANDLSNVRVFGSVARGDDNCESDIDFLVTPGPEASLANIIQAGLDIEILLGIEVDIISDGGLKPVRHDRIVAEAVAL